MELKDLNPAVADKLSTVVVKERMSLYPPATDLALRIDALFRLDPNVFTIWDYNNRTLKVFVKGAKKADAVNWLLRHRRHDDEIHDKFDVKVVCVYENGLEDELPSPTYDVNTNGVVAFLKDALEGIGFGWEFNDVFVPLTQTTYHYLEVEARPVAVGNDNFGNPMGYTVVLPEELVKLAFDTGSVMVSTYVRRQSNKPGSNPLGYAFTW